MQATKPDSGSESEKFSVIGVLGGPGSGKGTQCKLLAQASKLNHISIGDVLREELKRKGSEYAAIIEQNMRAGTVGPKEITVGILKSYILAAAREGTDLFILDGFPRNLEQAQYFEEIIGPIEFVIVLECPDAILTDRLLLRKRFDDNLESIRKRLRTFHDTTSQVIESFSNQGKVKAIDANNSIEAINEQLVRILEAREEAS
ncbi:adenylate kinase-domain-containing protein [Nemania abortiva]|nr:adenylate kinase-domain-containing protein [Nemania abortiva]